MVSRFKKLFSRSVSQETGGFDVQEQPTPFLGKLLLMVLAVVLLFFGWRGLDSLGDIPAKPEKLSSCFVQVGPPFFARGEEKSSRFFVPAKGWFEAFPVHIFLSSSHVQDSYEFRESGGFAPAQKFSEPVFEADAPKYVEEKTCGFSVYEKSAGVPGSFTLAKNGTANTISSKNTQNL